MIIMISVLAVLTTEIIWAMRLIMRLRAGQLNRPEMPLDKQWYWTWSRIILGGVLATGAGMALLFLIAVLPDKNSEIGIAHLSAGLVLLSVVMPGIGGLMLFRSGLKAKAALDMDV